MSQRLIAACLAVPAVLGLLLFASLARLPYATYQPGGTVDILGKTDDDTPVIEIEGHESYRDDGELRMTTVRVSPAQSPDQRGISLTALLGTWVDGDNAVLPYDAVHAPTDTVEGNKQAGQLQMATSQDSAIDVAMEELGIDVPQVIAITDLTPGLPAEKAGLEVGDVITTIDDTAIESASQLVDVIEKSGTTKPLAIEITREGKPMRFEVTPVERDGAPKIGITPDISEYEFPFTVKINVPEEIGGPSAGLIFSLAVYDTLTPGSLTGGHDIAGTGEIFPNGAVGPIGGIQQKIAGARDEGADLFLVPIDNCESALGADPGDMRLMMVQTMHDARVGIEAFADDAEAPLPSCKDAAKILAEAGR
ncbi:YlbL family protein [Nocardioides sp. GXZ039]|uniref:YlbL family protein n=1 Tax=Nocardioides sp. GXZ039 TaxID=3136018 RepID=UPI0030F3855B